MAAGRGALGGPGGGGGRAGGRGGPAGVAVGGSATAAGPRGRPARGAPACPAARRPPGGRARRRADVRVAAPWVTENPMEASRGGWQAGARQNSPFQGRITMKRIATLAAVAAALVTAVLPAAAGAAPTKPQAQILGTVQ